ncbi:MAG: STAS domain-containing protein [Mycobacteriaceae bacterium]|nr:STAS domain-containing protein [Mycobacteriaceae bacterium]
MTDTSFTDGRLPQQRLGIAIGHRGPTTIASVSGVLDSWNARWLGHTLQRLLGDQPSVLVADLTAVGLIDQVGARMLADTAEHARPSTEFRIVADGPAIIRTIGSGHPRPRYTVYSARDHAVADT